MNASNVAAGKKANYSNKVGFLFKFLASRDFLTRAMREGFRASSAC